MRPSARAHAAIPRYAHDDRHASGSLQGSSRGPTISMKWASILIDRRARTVRRDPNPPPPPPSQGYPHTASPRRGDGTRHAKPSHMQSRASRNPDLCESICIRQFIIIGIIKTWCGQFTRTKHCSCIDMCVCRILRCESGVRYRESIGGVDCCLVVALLLACSPLARAARAAGLVLSGTS